MPDVSSRPSPKDEGREETIRQLLVLAGPDKGKVFPLPETGTVRIGRAATAEIRLLDVRVSRAHCELQVTADQVILTAPEGQRSAYVNEVRVTADKLLSPGDILRVGETELRFDVPDVAGLKTIYGDVHEALREIAGEGKISVMCTCGQELVARARYAGTRVRCPACEEFVTLPGRAARTPHAEDSSVLTVEGKEEEMSLETNALPVTGRTNPVIIVALAAAGLLLLAALGVLYWIKMQS
jgi:pSer/pThr/pTyr-binding forkhead associated (FHA) protein